MTPKSKAGVAIGASVLVALVGMFGLDMSAEESLAIAGGIAAAIAVAMRGRKPPTPPAKP